VSNQWLVALLIVSLQTPTGPPDLLSAAATTKLRDSLKAASAHRAHRWRDTPPFEGQLLNAIVEIPRGERRKFEFNMAKNAPAVDRVLPKKVGGYPVNYGIVPQTVGYDGDPFDVLVLGPAIPAGRLVKGVIVGLMQFEDETGLDSKVVISRVGADGKPLHQLTGAEQARIAAYFNRYKKDDDDPKTFATVPGWGSAADGLAFVRVTHAFFKECEPRAGAVCVVMR
jgi:inorganic pyrophosphatase